MNDFTQRKTRIQQMIEDKIKSEIALEIDRAISQIDHNELLEEMVDTVKDEIDHQVQVGVDEIANAINREI